MGSIILAMQSTTGKLREGFAPKLACDLEDREILPAIRWDFRPWKCTWKRQLHLHMMHMKKKKAVSIGLGDSYHRTRFKPLIDLFL